MANRAIRGNVVIPVTVQTGAHLQRLSLFWLNLSHAGHVAVADGTGFGNRQRFTDGLAIDSGPRRLIRVREKSDVGLVNEPHVVRQPVHPLPVNGIVFFEALPYFGYLGFGCFPGTTYRLVAEETLFTAGTVAASPRVTLRWQNSH